MIDLTSDEMQSNFKKLQRITFATNVVMCLVTAFAAAIAIWGTATAKGKASWSEIMFYILIGAIVLYFAAVLAWEIVLRRKHSAAMHAFIAEGFFAHETFLQGGGNVFAEVSLAGDKLVVMRENSGEYVQFDLAPIKNYSSVCAYTVRLAKRFVRDYYSAAALRGSVDDVVLTDRIRRRAKKRVYVENGKPRYEFLLKFSYYLKHGIIK